MTSRRWRVGAIVAFPTRLQVIVPGDSPTDLPKQLGLKKVFHDDQRVNFRERNYLLTPYNGPTLPMNPGQSFEPVCLVTLVEAASAGDAIDVTEPDIETILDDLSFQTQIPLQVCQLEVLDVTPPVAVGDIRECGLFPYPQGFATSKFQRSNYLSNIVTAELPMLRTCEHMESPKVRASLRWYLNGLAASTDAAKFMAFWIALEILVAGEGAEVQLPYRAQCGHEIPFCPSCGHGTSRRMGGTEIQNHLVAHFGIQKGDARKLWQLRMIFHGANSLTKRDMADLPRLTALCWGISAAALKQAMRYQQDHLPLVSQQAIAWHNMQLGTERAVRPEDLKN